MLIYNAVGVNSSADSHAGFLHKIFHIKKLPLAISDTCALV